MKAAVYYEVGGPDVLRYEEVADPPLHPKGVIVEVAAIGIQGGDTLNRGGGALTTVPHIVGYQASGTVIEVGAAVTLLSVGLRVVVTTGFGSHAELVAVPETAAWVIPDSVSFDQAAGVPIEFGTASDCLFEFGHLQAGQTVLIQAGAGGVGLAAIQLATAAGASLILATASSDDRLERLREHGLDHGINYAQVDVPSTVRKLTEGRGVDLVVDPVGGPTLAGSVRSLAYRGRVSWVGNAGRENEPVDISTLMGINGAINGVFLGAELALNPGRTRPMIAALLDRVATGELTVVTDRVFPLAEAAEAHRYIESRQAFGRVLLHP
ncbi:MAG: zinc-binding dehydrogenase [Ilumatobacteraceae bacterium]